jgi:hypothetical protein
MSTEQDKIKHSKRIHDTETYIKRQVKIATHLHGEAPQEGHVYHKVSADTCGNANCVMCGNPRRMWGERTMQEQRLFQDKLQDTIDAPLDTSED